MKRNKKIQSLILFSSIAIVFICILGISHIFITTEADINAYKSLIKKRKEIINRSLIKSKPIEQLRKNVQKDIWIHNKKNRLHVRLSSEQSELTITHQHSKITFEEQLYNIHCFFQDKLSFHNQNPKQHIRYFTAEKGIYSFPSHQFVANKASISFFQLDGNELPSNVPSKNAYLYGKVDKIFFQIKEKTPYFQASHFSSRLNLDKVSYDTKFLP